MQVILISAILRLSIFNSSYILMSSSEITSSEVLKRLRESGYRITKSRKATLEVLIQKQCALSVPEVSALLLELEVKPNISTLYRELQFLTEQGITQEIVLKDGIMRYEIDQANHHHHLVCNACESIEPVEIQKHLQSVEQSIQSEKRFQILSHSLEFYGLCESCH
ncbi:MAG: Fur family transcriptional regulator [Candidatus Gracilibacteria bacterium]|nr:Fur family transcriptional regulator [Candidatus Gracilibacteria bacterium]